MFRYNGIGKANHLEYDQKAFTYSPQTSSPRIGNCYLYFGGSDCRIKLLQFFFDFVVAYSRNWIFFSCFSLTLQSEMAIFFGFFLESAINGWGVAYFWGWGCLFFLDGFMAACVSKKSGLTMGHWLPFIVPPSVILLKTLRSPSGTLTKTLNSHLGDQGIFTEFGNALLSYPPLSNDRSCLTTDPRSDRTFWSDPRSDCDFGGR